MLKNLSAELQLQVLLRVVKGAIKSSKNAEIFRLNEILKEKSGEVFTFPQRPILTPLQIKEKIKHEIREKVKAKFENVDSKELKSGKFELSRISRPQERPKQLVDKPVSPNPFSLQSPPVKQRPIPKKLPLSKKPMIRRNSNIGFSKRVLKIPEPNLPQRLRHIKPVVTEKEIDLGKLNPFVQDRNVKLIEIGGENETVFVEGNMGRMPTGISLSRSEIEEVINRFSLKAKIPVSNGVFKVAFGKFILTAMISDSVSPRFVLEKIKNPSAPPNNFRR